MANQHSAKRPARFENDLIYLLLADGAEAFVDDTAANRALVLCRNWHASDQGYATSSAGGKAVTLHRLLMPDAPMVDHINMDKLDNRLCNLRPATHSQNRMNSKPNEGRALKGAYPQRRSPGGRPTGKWCSYITINSKAHYIGTFDTQQAAHEAWMVRACERDPNFVRGS